MLFEVLDGHDETERRRRMETRQQFEDALDALIAGQLDVAQAGLQAVAAANPSDTAAVHLLERCRRLGETGLPPDWDGVARLTSK